MSKIFIVIVIIALFAGAIFWWQKDNVSNLFFGELPKACTQEAKLCPDGSYVGRTGPNCEFAQCPEPSACENLCGDGTCQEIVCMAVGCPCPETKESCPQDCDYYEKLAKQCKEEKGMVTNCCLESVDSMRANGYKQAENGKCPEGFEVNQLVCVNSLQWCQPK